MLNIPAIFKCLYIGLMTSTRAIRRYVPDFQRRDFSRYRNDKELLAQYGEWASRVAEGQDRDNDPLRWYTGNYYLQVNKFLRDRDNFQEMTPASVVEKTKEIEARFRSIMCAAPCLSGNHILYRFVDEDVMLRIISSFTYSGYYEDRAFLSTTWNPRLFWRKSRFVLRLFVSDGTRSIYLNASPVAGDENEFEVVLPPSRLFLLRKPYLGRHGVYVDCFVEPLIR